MEDFVVVSRKKNRKRKDCSVTTNTIRKTIADVKLELISSQFYTDFLDLLKRVLRMSHLSLETVPSILSNLLSETHLSSEVVPSTSESSSNVEIVCFGLGSFMETYIARYQLGLLLALRDELQIKEDKCEVYDPIFTLEEVTTLTDLGVHVLKHNEEGKRKCKDRVLTIFYMPHCGKALYNNVLWSNWGTQLRNIVIIGNSFTSMLEMMPSRILDKTANYVVKVSPYVKEFPVIVPSQYESIFNDTSLHTFMSNSQQDVPKELWEYNLEPSYDQDEAEIIFR